ncbi:hypothetical protein FXO38_06160 [Capsicum annuum]|nr:hypothetical protein FXO38_06160 [Capsicum annuum]
MRFVSSLVYHFDPELGSITTIEKDVTGGFSVSSIPPLGNEAEKGVVVFSWHATAAKDFSIEGDCFLSKVIPEPLKEEWMVAIRFLDAIKSNSDSYKIGEDVTKHSMVPMGVLGLKSPDCLLKAKRLSEAVMDQNHQSRVMGFDKSFTLVPKAHVVILLSVPNDEIHEVSWNARARLVCDGVGIHGTKLHGLESYLELLHSMLPGFESLGMVYVILGVFVGIWDYVFFWGITPLASHRESQKQIEENIIEELTTKMNKVLKGKEDVTIETDPYDVNDFSEYTELSIKKLEDEIQNQIEVSIIKELTTKMNEVLKEKEDVTIEKNPYDVNDLAYMKKEKPKQARKVMKVNLGGEGSISNVSQPFIR